MQNRILCLIHFSADLPTNQGSRCFCCLLFGRIFMRVPHLLVPLIPRLILHSIEIPRLHELEQKKLLDMLQEEDRDGFRNCHAQQHVVELIKVLIEERLIEDLDVRVHELEDEDLGDVGSFIGILVLVVFHVHRVGRHVGVKEVENHDNYCVHDAGAYLDQGFVRSILKSVPLDPLGPKKGPNTTTNK